MKKVIFTNPTTGLIIGVYVKSKIMEVKKPHPSQPRDIIYNYSPDEVGGVIDTIESDLAITNSLALYLWEDIKRDYYNLI